VIYGFIVIFVFFLHHDILLFLVKGIMKRKWIVMTIVHTVEIVETPSIRMMRWAILSSEARLHGLRGHDRKSQKVRNIVSHIRIDPESS